MTIREQLELRELEYLSSYAALSKDSKAERKLGTSTHNLIWIMPT